jgi:hypothetical protein
LGRYFTIGFFVFLAVLFIVMSIPSFMDWNKYKGSIESALGDATGRTVKIEGPVSFVVLPQPALTMADVSMFADGEEPFLTLEQMAGKVALAPLLRGQVRVTSLKLVGANLTSNGGSVAQRGAEEVANILPPAERRGMEGFLIGLIRDVRVDSLLIEDLAIRQGGVGSAPSLVIEDGAISFPSLDGPFKSETTVSLNAKRFRLVSEVGHIAPGRATSVSVEGFSGDGTEVSFQGSARDIKTAAEFTGALRLSGKGLAPVLDLMHVFGGDAGAQASSGAQLDLPMTLTGDVSFGKGSVEASGLQIRLGDTNAVMSVEFTQGSSLEGLMDISVTKIDGDALMAAWTPATATTTGALQESGVEVRLASDGVTYKGKVLRGLIANGYLSGSQFQLATLGATAPGNTKIAVVSGALADGQWQGDVTVATPNARQFISWLGMDVSQVPPSRLGTGNFKAKMVVAPKTIGFSDMVFDIDGNQYQGALRQQRSERLSFGAKISGARLNLQDYGSDRSFEQLDEWLGGFDANLDLSIASFSGFGVSNKSVNAKGTLVRGAAKLESLAIGGSDGATLTASGDVSNFAVSALKGDIDWRVKNWPSCDLVKDLQLDAALTCSAEDKVSLRGHLSLNQGIAHTSARGTALGAELDFKANGVQVLWQEGGSIKLAGTSALEDLAITFDGTAEGFDGTPRFTFQTKIKAEDAVSALARIGVDYGGPTKSLNVSGSWSGTTEDWALENLHGSMGEAEIAGTISLNGQDTGRILSADLSISNADAKDFLQSKVKILSEDGIWSRRTLKPIWPEDLRGSVTLNLTQISFGEVVLASGSVKGQIDEGRSEWALYNGNVWGGVWTGKANITRGRKGLVVEARARGEQVVLPEAAAYFSNASPIEGRGDLSFQLSGEGSNAFALAKSANGTVGLESLSGSILGMNLSAFERSLENVSGAIGVQLASEDSLSSGASEYQNLVGEFAIKAGAVSTSHWQSIVGGLETRLYVKGEVASRALKGDMEFIFGAETKYPAFAYSIRGSVIDPSGSWDTWSLEEYFAEKLKAEQEAAAAAAAATMEATPPPSQTPSTSRDVESGDLAPLQ